MLLISRTPLRISFFGGGSDYPAFYLRSAGAVLGTTIDHYTYISLKTFESRFFDHRVRVAYSKTELVKELKEIEHPSVRACLLHHQFEQNLDIHIFNDLPARTGLGSSSSFTVGLLRALHELKGEALSKGALAEEARMVEQQLIGENVGSQDQFHASFGGFNLMEFSKRGVEVYPVGISTEKQAFLESHLMLFYTGMTRLAHEVTAQQIQLTEQKKNDASLKRMVQLTYEALELVRASEGEKMVRAFGELLHESWSFKRGLSSHISTPAIDALYARGLEAGAYGGKLLGAGSGGFLLFVVPEEAQSRLREALCLPEVKCRFEESGSTLIYTKG